MNNYSKIRNKTLNITNKKFCLYYNVAKTEYNISLNYPRKLNRKQRNKISIHIKHAIENMNDLCNGLLEFPLQPEYFINVIFEKSKEWSGCYNTINQNIKIDTEYLINISRFESIFFHELMHYMFYQIFERNYKSNLNLLIEGSAHYFEKMYYPPRYNYFSFLFKDRLTDKDISTGFYLTNELIQHHLPLFRSFLKNGNEDQFIHIDFILLVDSLIEGESLYFEKLISENIDFVITDLKSANNSNSYICIYRDNQFEAPFLIRINNEDIIKYAVIDGRIYKTDLSRFIQNDFKGGFLPKALRDVLASYYIKYKHLKPEIWTNSILYCEIPLSLTGIIK